MTWTEFERQQPALAAEGRRQIYQRDIAVPARGTTPGPPRPVRSGRPPAGRRDRPSIGLGFLATVRADGGPRVHPVCPVISAAGLHVLVVAGPKQADLRRDGHYALHSDTCPPPRHEDGFSVTGRAREVTDPAVRRAVREQVLAERGGSAWPGLDDDALFELGVDRCLLMLTEAGETFPRGPTIWRAPRPASAPR